MTARAENCIERTLVEKAGPIVEALRSRRLSAVTAESCTAGLVAAILSHAPHAGECLHGGYVVYSKEHKTAALGVDPTLLQSRGSVNAEVALQMARGALTRAGAGVAVAITGAVTALFAASVALVENDIKRVLAYSTISQLGFMFMALGLNAGRAAMYHGLAAAGKNAGGFMMNSYSLNPGFSIQGNLNIDFDPEKITATYREGVLEIEVPKKEEAKPKQIRIAVQ